MIAWLKKLLHRHRWEFVGGDWVKGHKGSVSLTIRGCACGVHQEMMHMKEFGMTFLEREWHEPLIPKYPKEQT
jgi:thiamine monophosphate kinase